MKNTIGNLLLLGISLSIVLIIGEVVSRYVSPISPGPSILSLDGHSQKISYIEAGKRFRIITPDFDAITSITKDGYRAPEATGDIGPDTIFIGDSFTYAQGVEDHQTFSALYCKATQKNCANLGVPGASTLYEVDRLEYYLKEKDWRPRMVHFFFFTGNDFSENLDATSKRAQGQSYDPAEINPAATETSKGLIESTFDLGLKFSNLLRVAYFKVLPTLRNNEEESSQSLNKALAVTKTEFTRLASLSKNYGFNYQLYVIYPEPEITHNKYQEIGKKIQNHSIVSLIQLGDLFKKDTSKYFFPSDGHFSVEGNKKLAEFLISRH